MEELQRNSFVAFGDRRVNRADVSVVRVFSPAGKSLFVGLLWYMVPGILVSLYFSNKYPPGSAEVGDFSIFKNWDVSVPAAILALILLGILVRSFDFIAGAFGAKTKIFVVELVLKNGERIRSDFMNKDDAGKVANEFETLL